VSVIFLIVLLMYSVVWWCCGGVSVEVMVVALHGSSWDCLGEVWISGVGTNCVRELYKGVAGVVLGEEAGAGWGDFLWKQPLLHGSMFVVTSSCLCFLGGLCVYGVWRVRVPLC